MESRNHDALGCLWDLPVVTLKGEPGAPQVLLIGTIPGHRVSVKRLQAHLEALQPDCIVIDGHPALLAGPNNTEAAAHYGSVVYDASLGHREAKTTSDGDWLAKAKRALKDYDEGMERVACEIAPFLATTSSEEARVTDLIEQLAHPEAERIAACAFAKEKGAKLVWAGRHPQVEEKRAADLLTAPRRLVDGVWSYYGSLIPLATTSVLLPSFPVSAKLQARMLLHAGQRDFSALQADGAEYLRQIEEEFPVFASSSCGKLFIDQAKARLAVLSARTVGREGDGERNEEGGELGATAASEEQREYLARQRQRVGVVVNVALNEGNAAREAFLLKYVSSIASAVDVIKQASTNPRCIRELLPARSSSPFSDALALLRLLSDVLLRLAELPAAGFACERPNSPALEKERCRLLLSALHEQATKAREAGGESLIVAVVSAALLPGMQELAASATDTVVPSPRRLMDEEKLCDYPTVLSARAAGTAAGAAFIALWTRRWQIQRARRPVPLPIRLVSSYLPLTLIAAGAGFALSTATLLAFFRKEVAPKVFTS